MDSILSQSFSDFELLLIDDGSSDLSGLFCDEYAIADKRVSAFHTDNNGVSGARQYGLNIAKGKYIQFIDSDDWIEQDCFEKLFLIAEDKNADIVINFPYRKYPHFTEILLHCNQLAGCLGIIFCITLI